MVGNFLRKIWAAYTIGISSGELDVMEKTVIHWYPGRSFDREGSRLTQVFIAMIVKWGNR